MGGTLVGIKILGLGLLCDDDGMDEEGESQVPSVCWIEIISLRQNTQKKNLSRIHNLTVMTRMTEHPRSKCL